MKSFVLGHEIHCFLEPAMKTDEIKKKKHETTPWREARASTHLSLFGDGVVRMLPVGILTEAHFLVAKKQHET